HSYALLNPNSGPVSITLVRMIENLTPSWDSLGTSICNFNGCFSNEADTIIDTYSSSNADDTIIMYFYCRSPFYSYLIQGAGQVRLRAFITSNPSQFIEVDFRGATSGAIGIKQISSLVKDFSLGQNYPNPFNPTTKIDFAIPKSEHASLRVYDILGREVKVLVNEFLSPGEYEVDFDAKGLSSGMYYYSLRSGDYVSVKKMVLVK
ncbi:MAG TPA: T9SS type A sorting domain-containing protein, partial [Ignavibacteria bacterium]|nr:T9SS type A sorting domain-containing protein [Ignavibacteria bacterium]